MAIDAVGNAYHDSGYDDKDSVPDEVVKPIGKRRQNQDSYQFEQHFRNAYPCPGIHVFVSNNERSIGDADELEQHGDQRTMENHLCGSDAFDGNNHLLVDVPHADYFTDDDQQNGDDQVQAQ